MAETEKEEGAEDTEAFLTTVRERYVLCIEADRENRDRAKEALAFRDLDQWDATAKQERENDEEGARPCLVVDKLNQHVHQVVNDERQNRPQMKAQPADDNADIEVAKIYDGLLRHIQYRSHADIAYDTSFEAAVDGGFGFFRLLTEYCDPLSFDQDFRIVRIRNRFSTYLDPERQEPDGSDAKYGFILYRVQKKEFKREFGKDGEEALGSFDYEGKEFTEWYGDDWVIYAEYFWKEFKKETIAQLPDGRVVLLAEVPEGVTPEKTRATETCKIRWRKVTATKILDDGEVVFDAIPIIEVVGNELDIEGRVKRSGMIRSAMDAQRVDNYATSAFVENVALAPRSSYVAAAGQLEGYEDDWRSANRRNISTLFYKPINQDGVLVPPPRREQPPGIPQGWLSILQQSEHNIQASMGRYNATLGAPSNETSGKAIANRNREGDTGSFHFSDNLARSLRHAGQLIVTAIPKVLNRKQVVRILGEDGTPGTAIVDPNLCGDDGKPCAYAEQPNEKGGVDKIYNLGVGKYDVVITTGPSYTTRRLEASEFMTQMAQAAKDPVTAQIITYLAVKNNDIPGADEAAKLIKKTLPQGIIEDDDSQDREAVMERRENQVKQAAQALGQQEAQVNAAHEQAALTAEQAQEHERKAQEAERKAQAKVDEVNREQAALEAAKREWALEQKLAEANQRCASMEMEGSMEGQMEGRPHKSNGGGGSVNVIDSAAAGPIESLAQAFAQQAEALTALGAGIMQQGDAMLQQSAQFTQAVELQAQAAAAPRMTTLINDASGMPVAARSEVVH